MAKRIAMTIPAWSSGMKAEASFWKNWVETRGYKWPEDFTNRLMPDREIDDWIGQYIDGMPQAPKILDVGAGPLTVLGVCRKGKRLDITATDPLAPLYSAILDNAGICPLVRTIFAPAEDLSAFFEPGSFDIVHCQNALDHSFDPIRGIFEMLRVVKVGGLIILRHNNNEAEHEKYKGFHQYNFDAENGRFVIWNKNERNYLDDLLPVKAKLEVMPTERSISVAIRKSEEFAHPVDYRERAKEMTSGFVEYYAEKTMLRVNRFPFSLVARLFWGMKKYF